MTELIKHYNMFQGTINLWYITLSCVLSKYILLHIYCMNTHREIEMRTSPCYLNVRFSPYIRNSVWDWSGMCVNDTKQMDSSPFQDHTM